MLALSLGLAFTACADADFSLSGQPRDSAGLDALQPYFIETCAVSEIKKKPGFGFENQGGVGGHAVLYLQGACLDQDTHYPWLRACDPTRIGPDTDTGVGISANAHFSNANWVATPGRDFFFNGGLVDGERLTRAAYLHARQEARRRRVLDGVDFHESVFDDISEGMSRDDFKYEVSIATDFAIAFGRGRYCARQPVTQAQMGRVIGYLNGLNAIHRSGQVPSEMRVLDNSCSHLTHNVLSAAGAWDPWPTGQFLLFAALSFPVPKNEFVNQMRRGNDMPLADPGRLFDDPAARAALLRDNWLPTAPGAIATSAPPVLDNEVYETDLSLIFYDSSILSRYARWFDAIFSEPRYTRPRENVQYFAALYDHLRANRHPVEWWLSRRHDTPAEQAAFVEFYRRYNAYIDSMSVEAGRMAASLNRTFIAAVQRP